MQSPHTKQHTAVDKYLQHQEIRKNLDSQLTSVVCKIVDDPATEMMIQKKISSQIDVKLQEK